MPTLGDSLLTLFASAGMVIMLILTVLPFIPASLLLWAITLAYGLATNFQHVSLLAFIIITIFTLLSVFRDFWMPFLGMKTRGASCSSVVGTIIGGTIGTFVIPIPVLGTLIGGMAGALILEIMRVGDLRKSMYAAGFAFETFVLSFILEFVINLIIVIVFFASLLIR